MNNKKRKIWSSTLSIIVALVVLFVIFYVLSPSVFLSLNNITVIVLLSAITGIMAMGELLVIVVAEIDLSVGAIMSLTGVVFAMFSLAGMNVFFAFILVILLGGLFGLLSGVLTCYIKIPSFIATLAVMVMANGIALLATNGETLMGISNSFLQFGGGRLLNIPIPIYILLVIFIITTILLHFTKFGLYLYSIGGNIEAARLSGVNVNFNKTLTFVLSGMFSAVAGIIGVGRLGVASPIIGSGNQNLDAIAAGVLGGASLFGGVGSTIGTLAGSFLMSGLDNGLTILGISSYWESVILGIVIIIALMAQENSILVSGIKTYLSSRKLGREKTINKSDEVNKVNKSTKD